jgi:hypothetical protein
MVDTLARYDEVRPNAKRQFELFADRVIVKSKTATADSVITVLLGDLRPDPNVAMCMAGGFLLVSLAVIAKTVRKVEFTQFVSNQGTPVLDVARAGPQCADFDAFIATAIGQIRANKGVGIKTPSVNAYTVFRDRAFSVKRWETGIAEPPASSPAWAVLMEMMLPNNGPFTVLALADGTSSIYFGNGGAVIGGQSQENVRQAAGAFLSAANDLHRNMIPAQIPHVPAVGLIAFYARTDVGLLAADVVESELRTGSHPYSPLFFAGHLVMAELRKTSEAAKAGAV